MVAVAVAATPPSLSGPSIITFTFSPLTYPLSVCTIVSELTPPPLIVPIAVEHGNENANAGCFKSKNLKP